jgi:DNA-binding IclR family transcriptional regulator
MSSYPLQKVPMPKKAALPALADENAAPGGIATLDRALSLLTAFSTANPTPTLAEIAGHARIHKSTVLRMLASLAHANLVHRRHDGRYTLGAEIERLHRLHTASFSFESVVMSVLRELVERTRESAAYHVRHGDQRMCLHRIDSPRPVRDHLQPGDLLPLDRGAGGRVLSAFSGARGKLYDQIRRDRLAVLIGDRTPELAGISAPVFGPDDALAGALTLTMPRERFDEEYAQPVAEAARRLTQLIGGSYERPVR